MGAMINSLRSFLLLELGKGLFLTLKYFFKRSMNASSTPRPWLRT